MAIRLPFPIRVLRILRYAQNDIWGGQLSIVHYFGSLSQSAEDPRDLGDSVRIILDKIPFVNML